MSDPFNAYNDVLSGKTTPGQVAAALKPKGQRVGKPVVQPTTPTGPSKDPAMQRATAAAKARSDAYLKSKKPR